jgi:hypothetical protein
MHIMIVWSSQEWCKTFFIPGDLVTSSDENILAAANGGMVGGENDSIKEHALFSIHDRLFPQSKILEEESNPDWSRYEIDCMKAPPTLVVCKVFQMVQFL